MISVLVVTRNNEDSLGPCLESLGFSDDIHVLDLGSLDDTRRMVRARGLGMSRRESEGLGRDLNWAMANLEFAHPLVFWLHGSERVTNRLGASMREVAENGHEACAFAVRTRTRFMGKNLYFAALPRRPLRLVDPAAVRFTGPAHPRAHTRDKVATLSGRLVCEVDAQGLADLVDRRNLETGLEASRRRAGGRMRPLPHPGQLAPWAPLHVRRQALGEYFLRLPFRAALLLVYLAIFRLGFLDGRAGLAHAWLEAATEYVASLKTRQERHPTGKRTGRTRGARLTRPGLEGSRDTL
jgi:hypothetical protein